MAKKEKQSAQAASGGKKLPGIRSIRGKLILLGLVAVLATAVLGMVGIYSLGSTNKNNDLLALINDVNLVNYENETLNVQFLYQLENSYNEQMRSNAEKMVQTLENAEKKSGAAYKASLSALKSDVQKTAENLKSLEDLMGSRGFTSEVGEYADFVAGDENLNQSFEQMDTEDGAWVDDLWTTYNVDNLPKEEIGGKTYVKITHKIGIPIQSKRDILVLRLGRGGIVYHGQVYITRITYGGKTDIDLSKLKDEDLMTSWGGCYEKLGMKDFNGQKAINFTGAYNAGNPDEWTENAIQIPISEYDVQQYKEADYDIYMEYDPDMHKEWNTTLCYTGKFDFKAALNSVNSDFAVYSKTIAEGKDAGEQAEKIKGALEQLSQNLLAYSVNEELNAGVSELLQKKTDAFTKANEADQQIVKTKNENNTLNESILKQIKELQTSIKSHTDATHQSTKVITIIIFVVDVTLVIMLMAFVIMSIGKSIRNFNGTLQKLAQGDMTVKAEVGRGDEFDAFGAALNHMTEKISSVLSSVNRIAADVNQSGNDLESVAKGTDENSSVIGNSIHDIVTGANDQAKDVEDSTLQMYKLGELMDGIIVNASELDETSDHMEVASADVKEILQKLSESNNNMTAGVTQIADLIRETNESVVQISDAANLISSIAEETNLLSLNASIEAARAGEVGKGFAVVAMEIQQLADQTNKSADSISTVIDNLTAGFRHTVDTMEQVQNATDEQNANLEETMRKFSIMNEGISASRSGARAIKESIDECNEVRGRINGLLLNLSALSEEYAAATTETGESMESLKNTIHELLTASEKLSEISGELENNMTYFNL